MKDTKRKIIVLCLLTMSIAASSCKLLSGKTGGAKETEASNVRLPISAAVNGKVKWGFMDGDGKRVIDYQFDAVDFFSEGLARVKPTGGECDCWGFIDETGKMVVKPQFHELGDQSRKGIERAEENNFSDGVAVATLQDSKKQVVIDKDGQVIFTVPEDYVIRAGFSEGLAKFSPKSSMFIYGFLDKTGKIVIHPTHSTVNSFHDGLAFVERPTYPTTYGFMDKTGKIVVEKLQYASDFSEGLAAVKINDKWGYIDNTGKTIIEPQFYEAGNFSDGWAAVKDGNGIYDTKPFYIDKTGKRVLELSDEFKRHSEFSEGLAWYGDDVIDKTGKVIGTLPNLPVSERGAIRKLKFKNGVSIMTDLKFAFYMSKTGREIKQQNK